MACPWRSRTPEPRNAGSGTRPGRSCSRITCRRPTRSRSSGSRAPERSCSGKTNTPEFGHRGHGQQGVRCDEHPVRTGLELGRLVGRKRRRGCRRARGARPGQRRWRLGPYSGGAVWVRRADRDLGPGSRALAARRLCRAYPLHPPWRARAHRRRCRPAPARSGRPGSGRPRLPARRRVRLRGCRRPVARRRPHGYVPQLDVFPVAGDVAEVVRAAVGRLADAGASVEEATLGLASTNDELSELARLDRNGAGEELRGAGRRRLRPLRPRPGAALAPRPRDGRAGRSPDRGRAPALLRNPECESTTHSHASSSGTTSSSARPSLWPRSRTRKAVRPSARRRSTALRSIPCSAGVSRIRRTSPACRRRRFPQASPPTGFPWACRSLRHGSATSACCRWRVPSRLRPPGRRLIAGCGSRNEPPARAHSLQQLAEGRSRPLETRVVVGPHRRQPRLAHASSPARRRRCSSTTVPAASRHLYCAMILPDLRDYRNAILRCYWDGDDDAVRRGAARRLLRARARARPRVHEPSWSTVNPGFGSSHGLNAYFPMPFASGARITLENRGRRVARRPDRRLLVPLRVRDATTSRSPDDATASTRATGRRRPTTPVGEPPNMTLHDGEQPRRRRELRRARHRRRGRMVGPRARDRQHRTGRLVRRGRRHGVHRRRHLAARRSTARAPRRSSAAARVPSTEYAGPYTGFHLDRVARTTTG